MPRPPQRTSAAAASPTDWSDISAWYDQLVGGEGSEYHREVVLPGVVRLLAAAQGQRVLDVACGQGVLCRWLAEKGVRTTGVDAAPDLIAAAKQHGSAMASADFFVGDARDLSMLERSAYDAAACVLAIQNIHPIGPVFATVAAALRPGGRFVVAMMHPGVSRAQRIALELGRGRQGAVPPRRPISCTPQIAHHRPPGEKGVRVHVVIS